MGTLGLWTPKPRDSSTILHTHTCIHTHNLGPPSGELGDGGRAQRTGCCGARAAGEGLRSACTVCGGDSRPALPRRASGLQPTDARGLLQSLAAQGWLQLPAPPCSGRGSALPGPGVTLNTLMDSNERSSSEVPPLLLPAHGAGAPAAEGVGGFLVGVGVPEGGSVMGAHADSRLCCSGAWKELRLLPPAPLRAPCRSLLLPRPRRLGVPPSCCSCTSCCRCCWLWACAYERSGLPALAPAGVPARAHAAGLPLCAGDAAAGLPARRCARPSAKSTDARCRGLPPREWLTLLLSRAAMVPGRQLRTLTSGLGHALAAGLAPWLPSPQPISCDSSCLSGVLAGAVWGVTPATDAAATGIAMAVAAGTAAPCGGGVEALLPGVWVS